VSRVPVRAGLTLAAALALLWLPAACGDEENGEPVAPGQPTTTTDGPDVRPGPGEPDPDRDLTALRCRDAPGETLDATALTGLGLPEAERRAERRGCSVRVVERDGESLVVTEDFRPDRVNLAVEDGEVVAIIGAY
jgi:hypothetical protein